MSFDINLNLNTDGLEKGASKLAEAVDKLSSADFVGDTVETDSKAAKRGRKAVDNTELDAELEAASSKVRELEVQIKNTKNQKTKAELRSLKEIAESEAAVIRKQALDRTRRKQAEELSPGANYGITDSKKSAGTPVRYELQPYTPKKFDPNAKVDKVPVKIAGVTYDKEVLEKKPVTEKNPVVEKSPIASSFDAEVKKEYEAKAKAVVDLAALEAKEKKKQVKIDADVAAQRKKEYDSVDTRTLAERNNSSDLLFDRNAILTPEADIARRAAVRKEPVRNVIPSPKTIIDSSNPFSKNTPKPDAFFDTRTSNYEVLSEDLGSNFVTYNSPDNKPPNTNPPNNNPPNTPSTNPPKTIIDSSNLFSKSTPKPDAFFDTRTSNYEVLSEDLGSKFVTYNSPNINPPNTNPPNTNPPNNKSVEEFKFKTPEELTSMRRTTPAYSLKDLSQIASFGQGVIDVPRSKFSPGKKPNTFASYRSDESKTIDTLAAVSFADRNASIFSKFDKAVNSIGLKEIKEDFVDISQVLTQGVTGGIRKQAPNAGAITGRVDELGFNQPPRRSQLQSAVRAIFDLPAFPNTVERKVLVPKPVLKSDQKIDFSSGGGDGGGGKKPPVAAAPEPKDDRSFIREIAESIGQSSVRNNKDRYDLGIKPGKLADPYELNLPSAPALTPLRPLDLTDIRQGVNTSQILDLPQAERFRTETRQVDFGNVKADVVTIDTNGRFKNLPADLGLKSLPSNTGLVELPSNTVERSIPSNVPVYARRKTDKYDLNLPIPLDTKLLNLPEPDSRVTLVKKVKIANDRYDLDLPSITRPVQDPNNIGVTPFQVKDRFDLGIKPNVRDKFGLDVTPSAVVDRYAIPNKPLPRERYDIGLGLPQVPKDKFDLGLATTNVDRFAISVGKVSDRLDRDLGIRSNNTAPDKYSLETIRTKTDEINKIRNTNFTGTLSPDAIANYGVRRGGYNIGLDKSAPLEDKYSLPSSVQSSKVDPYRLASRPVSFVGDLGVRSNTVDRYDLSLPRSKPFDRYDILSRPSEDLDTLAKLSTTATRTDANSPTISPPTERFELKRTIKNADDFAEVLRLIGKNTAGYNLEIKKAKDGLANDVDKYRSGLLQNSRFLTEARSRTDVPGVRTEIDRFLIKIENTLFGVDKKNFPSAKDAEIAKGIKSDLNVATSNVQLEQAKFSSGAPSNVESALKNLADVIDESKNSIKKIAGYGAFSESEVQINRAEKLLFPRAISIGGGKDSKEQIETQKFQQLSAKVSAEVSNLRLQKTRRDNNEQNTFIESSGRVRDVLDEVKTVRNTPGNSNLFNDRLSRLSNQNEKVLLSLNEAAAGASRSLGGIAQEFFFISNAVNSFVNGVKNLTAFASSRDLAGEKLDVANKLNTSQSDADVQFLQRTTKELGLSFSDSVQDLARFKLSTPLSELDRLGNVQQSAISSEQVNTIFKGIADVSTANQLSQGQIQGINNVIIQSLSKGKVAAQELKLQLPNFLPGAVNLFARSQGIDGNELSGRLRRDELSIDSLVDFTRLLTKDFGELAKIDNPAKSLNKFISNLENVVFKASQFPANAAGGALKIGNPIAQGVEANTSTFTPLAVIASVGIAKIFSQNISEGLSAGLRTRGVKTLVNSLFAGIDFSAESTTSIRKQISTAVLGGVEEGKKSPKLTDLGKGVGLILGAGLLSTVSVALFGGEGLDALFGKFTKNAQGGLQQLTKNIKLPGFTGDERLKGTGEVARDTLSQIIPLAAGIAGAGLIGKSAVSKFDDFRKTSDTFVKSPKLNATAGAASGAVSALSGLAATPAIAIAAAVATYVVANSTFITAYAEVSAKTVKKLDVISAELSRKTNQPSGATASTFEAFKIESRKGVNNGIFGLDTLAGKNVDDVEEFTGNLRGVGRQRLVQRFDEEEKNLKSLDAAGRRGVGYEESKLRLSKLRAEIERRANGGEQEIKSGLAKLERNANEDRFKELESASGETVVAINRTIEALKTPVSTTDVSVEQQQLLSDRAERAGILSRTYTNQADSRADLDRVTELDTRINTNKFKVNEALITPLKDRVSSATVAIQESENDFNNQIATVLAQGGIGADKTPRFLRIKKAFQEAQDKLKVELIAAQDALNAVDPAFSISQEAIRLEQVARKRTRDSNDQGVEISKASVFDVTQRRSEGQDRDSSLRQSSIGKAVSINNLDRAEKEVEDLESSKRRLELLPPSEESEKAFADLTDKLSAARAQVESSRVDVAKAENAYTATLEENSSKVAALNLANTSRDVERVELRNKDILSEIRGNEVNVLQKANIDVDSASNAENLADFEVRLQEDLLTRTTLNREVEEQKLEDLRTRLLQRGIEKRAAERSRLEVLENRDIELTNQRNVQRSQDTELFSTRTTLNSLSSSRNNERDGLVDATNNVNLADRKLIDAKNQVIEQEALAARAKFTTETQILKLSELRVSVEKATTDAQSARLQKFKVDLDAALRSVDRTFDAAKQTQAERQNRFDNSQAIRAANIALPTVDRFGSDLSLRTKAQEIQTQNAGLSQLQSAGLNPEFSRLQGKLESIGVDKLPTALLAEFKKLSPEQIAKVSDRLVESKNSVNKEERDLGGNLISRPTPVDLGVASLTLGSGLDVAPAIDAFLEFTSALRGFSDDVVSRKQQIELAKTELKSIAISSQKQSLAEVFSLETATRNNLKDKDLRETRQGRERSEVSRIFQDAGKTSQQVGVIAGVNSKIDSFTSNNERRGEDNKRVQNQADALIAEKRDQQKRNSESPFIDSATLKSVNSALDRNIFAIQKEADSRKVADNGEDITSISKDLATAIVSVVNQPDRTRQEEIKREQRVDDGINLRNTLRIGTETEVQTATRGINTQVRNQRNSIDDEIKTLSKEAKPADIRDALERLKSVSTGKNLEFVRGLEDSFNQLESQGLLSSEAINKTIESLRGLAITEEERLLAIKKQTDTINNATKVVGLNNASDLASSVSRQIRSNPRRDIYNPDENEAIRLDIVAVKRKAEADLTQIENERSQAGNLTEAEDFLKFGQRAEKVRVDLEASLNAIQTTGEKISTDLSKVFSSQVNFTRAFQTAFGQDGSLDKALVEIGSGILDGLSNYFTTRAQSALQTAFEGLFDGLLDGILGSAEKSLKGSKKSGGLVDVDSLIGEGLGVVKGLFGGDDGGGDIVSSLLSGFSGLLPGFYDGTEDVKSGYSFPQTFTPDVRERGLDSRMAIINSKESVIPSYMAQDFLQYRSYLSRLGVSNTDNRSSNQYTNTTNNYSIQQDTFRRTNASQTVINDQEQQYRDRFK